MKAIGYRDPLQIENEDSLLDIDLKTPKAAGKDLLVEIKAIATNPVDYKIRQGRIPADGTGKCLVGKQLESLKK